jgi:hypothetical protein
MERRQISEKEKTSVVESHTKDGKIRCFIDNHPMDLGEVEFHHIKAYSLDGPTELSNIAPVCKEHHKRVGTLSLEQFRDRLEMERFFEASRGRRLDDVLSSLLGEFGKRMKYDLGPSSIKLYLPDGPVDVPISQCPATKYKYFYFSLPTQYIKNDSDLQPRLLEPDRLWELYLHLSLHTQLAPAVCRMVNGEILLFDGQHKTAAQVWARRPRVDCKVYVEPDALDLKETNLTAHYNLRQMPFYTSTLMQKYADVFHEYWVEYSQKPGSRSESGFIRFLMDSKGKSRAEGLRMLRLAIQNNVIDHQTNSMAEYVSERNRARSNPLTISIMQKTFFADFIVPPALEVEFESAEDHRDHEKSNLIRILNLLTQETLAGHWNPELDNSAHKTSARIYAAGSMRAWVPLLRDVVAQILKIFDEDERRRVLFREINDEDFTLIHGRIKRLFTHKVWRDPDPDVDSNLRINNADHVKRFLKDRGLTSNWVLGGKE